MAFSGTERDATVLPIGALKLAVVSAIICLLCKLAGLDEPP